MSDAAHPTNNKAHELPPNTKSLDELFALAERQTQANGAAIDDGSVVVTGAEGASPATTDRGPTADAVQECSHPDTIPPQRGNCSICHKVICHLCASPMDPVACRDCLSEESVTMKESPLVDQDGVTHEGRLLTPGPTFNTLARSIADMTTIELEDHIKRYKSLIKQAETALDFRRVSLGMAQVEMGQRQDQQRRRLRGIKVPRARTVSVSDPSKPAPKPAPNLMQMAKAIEQIMQLRKIKQQQAATAASATAQPTKPTEVKP